MVVHTVHTYEAGARGEAGYWQQTYAGPDARKMHAVSKPRITKVIYIGSDLNFLVCPSSLSLFFFLANERAVLSSSVGAWSVVHVVGEAWRLLMFGEAMKSKVCGRIPRGYFVQW